MAGEPDLVGLLYRADWTRLSLSAEVNDGSVVLVASPLGRIRDGSPPQHVSIPLTVAKVVGRQAATEATKAASHLVRRMGCSSRRDAALCRRSSGARSATASDRCSAR